MVSLPFILASSPRGFESHCARAKGEEVEGRTLLVNCLDLEVTLILSAYSPCE